ncbi:TRAP transporter small permease [Sneathiella chinensis]|nr:TRAP transporter small permease [Sneathiella chinensis]
MLKTMTKGIHSTLIRVEWTAAGFGLFFITLAVIGDVVMREAGTGGIQGAVSIAVLVMIMTGFLGVPLAFDDNRHLRITVFDGLWPWGAELLRRLSCLLSAGLLLCFAWYGGLFALESYELGEQTVMFSLPLWPAFAVLPYAFLSAAVRMLLYLCVPDLQRNREKDFA